MTRSTSAGTAAAILCVCAGLSHSASTFTLDIQPASVMTVPPAGTWGFHISGALSGEASLGLAGFGVDLVPGTGVTLSLPLDPGPCMSAFAPGAGFANPAGFGGTLVGGSLLQIGGAQNSIGNPGGGGNPPSPSGTVAENVAVGTPAALASGTITVPTTPGTYTVSLANPMATVLRTSLGGSPPAYTADLAACVLGPNGTAQIIVAAPAIRNRTRDIVYSTIQAAVNDVLPGETIEVPPGLPLDPVTGSPRNFVLLTTNLADWDTVDPGRLVLPRIATSAGTASDWGAYPAANSVRAEPEDGCGLLGIALLAPEWTAGPVQQLASRGYRPVGVWEFDPVPFGTADLTFRDDGSSPFIASPFAFASGQGVCEAAWTFDESKLALAQYDGSTSSWRVLGHDGANDDDYHIAASVAIPAALGFFAVVQQFPGDVDLDGCVDVFDVIAVVNAFGRAPGDPGWVAGADFDGSGTIDVFDVMSAVNAFGNGLLAECPPCDVQGEGLQGAGGMSMAVQAAGEAALTDQAASEAAMTAPLEGQADSEAAAAREILRRIDQIGIRDQVAPDALERLEAACQTGM